MYKLENDVQWTTELKDAFKHNITRATILMNGDEYTEDNNIKELEIDEERYISNLGFIGTATSRKVELILVKTNSELNFENQEFVAKIGADYNGTTYYINYGNFIVDKAPENDETNDTIRVVAYDYMIKFNKVYENRVTYPCTLLTLLNDICNQANVTLGSESFYNSNFIVENNQFEGNTLREVLQNIAKCAFSWARIGQDNKLYLDFKLNSTNTEAITINDYKLDGFKKANEYYGPVNQVTYADSDLEGQEARVKDQSSIDSNGLKELVIYDNMFAYTPEKRNQLIQAGVNILGLEYMPIMELQLIGLAYLDCTDKINVSTLDGSIYSSRVFNHKIKYTGVLNDDIVTEGSSDNEEAYKNTANDVFQNQQTRFIIDKANKMMKSVIENVDEQNTKISEITQTVDELNSKISDIADITTSQETTTGRLIFTEINQSEPIRVEIRPIGQNISYLYIRNNIFPANDLYITLRTLRFTNTTTNEVFDYELPDDLLYYNSENYDTFILDYANGNDASVTITKKCQYDTNGNVVLLSESRVDEYSFPHINLTDGDYRVEILKYDNTPYVAYLFARLMAQNIYTSQFAIKAEVNSQISQTAENINTSVNRKLTNYSTTQQMNTAINQSADSITSSVSRTYATKNQLNNYSTTQQMNTAISQSAENITTEVSNSYVTKANANSTYETKNHANSTYATKSTVTQTATNLQTQINSNDTDISTLNQTATNLQTQITNNAGDISTLTQTTNGLSTQVSQKVGKNEVISRINQSSEAITISANKLGLTANDVINIISGNAINLTSKNISIQSTHFNVDKNGNVNCSNINATNGTFTGDLYMAANQKLASTSQGIMSTLFASGTGPFNGYEYLGYGLSLQGRYQRTSPMVSIYIPDNFTPVYAYLFIEQIQSKFILNSGTVRGRSTATKVRKGSSGPTIELYGFASEYFMNMNALSGTDITNNAFGSSTIVPNVGITVSNNIANKLTKGQLNVLSAYITDGQYDNREATFEGNEQADIGAITGLAKLSIQVIGYLNPF